MNNLQLHFTRRHFFGQSATGLGVAALAGLLNEDVGQAFQPDRGGHETSMPQEASGQAGKPDLRFPHFAPKAKRVIYLFQSGAPSQMDLFDYKPKLNDLRATELPDSIRKGQRLTGMTATPGAASPSRRRCSSSRSTAKAGRGSASCCRTRRRSPTSCASSSRCTPRRSTTTRRSRSSRPGRSSPAGRASGRGWPTAWAATNQDLPAFVVRWSRRNSSAGQPLYDRLWGSGFLPSQYQGVKFRSGGDPVLYLSNPEGHRPRDPPRHARRPRGAQPAEAARDRRPGDRHAHRAVRDGLPHADVGPGADRHLARSRNPRLDLYGPDAQKPGTFAAQLPARPPAGRARRAVRAALPPRLGSAHELAEGASAGSAATPTSRRRRWSPT